MCKVLVLVLHELFSKHASGTCHFMEDEGFMERQRTECHGSREQYYCN